MKLFVTGGTGFIGRVFLEHLLRDLPEDAVIHLLIRKPADFDDPRIHPLVADLTDIGKAREQLLECDYVFHLGGNATFGDEADYDAVNYEPTRVMVEILKESLVLKCLVFTSTIGAVDRAPSDRCRDPLTTESSPFPRSRYGESKLKAERCIQVSGIPSCIIRPTWVYGSGMRTASHISRFVSMVLARHPVTKVNFPGRVSLIHVNDLALALVRCIGNQEAVGRVFFAETESLSLGTIFACIARRLTGAAPSQLSVPSSFAPPISRLHGRLPLTIANLFIGYLWASNPGFRDCFCLTETVRFEQGIDDVIAVHPKVNGYWVITGANSGIGLALSRKLDGQRVPLLLIDCQVDKLGEFNCAEVLQADLTSEADIDRICNVVGKRRIRCLVNNAGIGVRGTLQDIRQEEIKRIVAINSLAPVLLTQGLIDRLIAQESVIINIASSIAYNPLPYMSLYSSSKAFVSNWSESLTYELRRTNRVVTFSPSGTLTSFQKTAGVKILNEGKGLLTPEYVATRIVTAEKKGGRVIILGWQTKMLLLISNCLPRSLNISLWGRLFEQYR